MKVPINWLKEYVDIELEPKVFGEAMTMSGSKVEGILVQAEEITKVVAGKILTVEKHPDADKLQVTSVDVGNEVIQIVTGAQNIKVSDVVPVAIVGATLPGGMKISKGKLRGVMSFGMMCSIQELNLTKDDYPDAAEHGIFILDQDMKPGTDVKKALELDETIVDFEITSNRPDCLSLLGIAREAAVTLNKTFKKPVIKVKEEARDIAGMASIEIKDEDLCPRYAARIIQEVVIEPSPKWMRDRLKAAGVRPINNIVDITNYVMLEYGQPMHAFDLDFLQEKKIIVRRAMQGEVMTTLDNQERTLDSSMLVIADGKRPVAVAGVMGGANSEIKPETKTILFESALFNGTSVRLTSKKLGLRTEASGRFEKGLDVENVKDALDRAVQLVEELGAGKVCKGMIDCYSGNKEKTKISFRPDKINALLGTDVTKEEMIRIFNALEMKVDEQKNTIEIPSFRADVEGEADLAEEVARFYGYNKIKATLLSGKSSTLGKKTTKQKVEDRIKNTMISCGLSEAYTYSFTSPKVFDRINLPADSALRKCVIISNPLGEDFSVMRTTTIPDMLEVLSRNNNRRASEANLFEVSNVYLPHENEKELPTQKPVLTIGMYGKIDFFDLKGIVEELLLALGIKKYDFEPEQEDSAFHPGRTAKLVINGKYAGIIGEIHPEVAEKFECPAKTYVGVLEVEQLVENTNMISQYVPLPKFPAVSRDLALLVKDEVLVQQMVDAISKKAGKILEEVKLFDIYKGAQVPEGMKSVAFAITFRADDRTLTDEEVNTVMDKILENVKTSFDAQRRE